MSEVVPLSPDLIADELDAVRRGLSTAVEEIAQREVTVEIDASLGSVAASCDGTVRRIDIDSRMLRYADPGRFAERVAEAVRRAEAAGHRRRNEILGSVTFFGRSLLEPPKPST